MKRERTYLSNEMVMIVIAHACDKRGKGDMTSLWFHGFSVNVLYCAELTYIALMAFISIAIIGSAVRGSLKYQNAYLLSVIIHLRSVTNRALSSVSINSPVFTIKTPDLWRLSFNIAGFECDIS